MDAISHLLRMAHVEASLDKRCLLGATTRMDVGAYAERQAPFHVLLEGTCRLHIGAKVLDLRAGDVVLIPSGASHYVTTPGHGPGQGTSDERGNAFVTTQSDRGDPAEIDLFCGHFSFGSGTGAMLFRSLPDPIHVSFGLSDDSDEVLRMLGTLMRGEAQREGTGTAVILSALSTVLLTMVLRTSSALNSKAPPLWTAAGDPAIASAVEQVLEEPGQDWSIERLSRTAAMSRATFLRRFVRATGLNVGAFVAQARLMTAADLLSAGDAPVAVVAARVGYRSESAFSRAFRSATGTTPAQFRRASVRQTEAVPVHPHH